jgi:hypothetical protein
MNKAVYPHIAGYAKQDPHPRVLAFLGLAPDGIRTGCHGDSQFPPANSQSQIVLMMDKQGLLKIISKSNCTGAH